MLIWEDNKARIPVEHNPLGDSDNTLLGLIESGKLCLDGIIGVCHRLLDLTLVRDQNDHNLPRQRVVEEASTTVAKGLLVSRVS